MTRLEQLQSLDADSLPDNLQGFEQLYGSTVQELISAYRRIEYLQNQIYGKRREQFIDERQLALGLGKEELERESLAPAEEEKEVVTYERKQRRGRKFANLPEIIQDSYPEPEELVCSCCGKEKIETKTEENNQLHFKPCELFKQKTIKHIFKCSNGCEPGLTSPRPEPHIIDKCLATPELLAHVLTSKFVDYQPLHRIGQIFERHGLELNDSTLIAWVNQFGAAVSTIVSSIKERILLSKLIGSDDTTVRVLNCASGKDSKREWNGSNLSRFWQYQSLEGYIYFHYTSTREGAGPQGVLEGFKGYLQADDYAGYNGVYRGGAIQVGCLAHARRNFFELPEKYQYRAEALRFFGELYRVERQIKTRRKDDPDFLETEVVRMREESARPVFDNFLLWLTERVKKVLPKSEFYQAAQYVLTNKEALSRYLSVSFLPIDNNWVERKIRPIAIGRKNWLFCGNNDTAQNAARILTLAANCQAAGVNPYNYFVYLIKTYSSTSSKNVFSLTPWGYKDFSNST